MGAIDTILGHARTALESSENCGQRQPSTLIGHRPQQRPNNRNQNWKLPKEALTADDDTGEETFHNQYIYRRSAGVMLILD